MTANSIHCLYLHRLKAVFECIDSTETENLRRFVKAKTRWNLLLMREIDDILQETRLRFWGALADGKFTDLVFDPSNGELRDAVRRWLSGTARNVVREFTRQFIRLPNQLSDTVDPASPGNDSVEQSRMDLQFVASRQSPKTRRILAQIVEGWTISEIAEIEGVARSTVYRRAKSLRSSDEFFSRANS